MAVYYWLIVFVVMIGIEFATVSRVFDTFSLIV